MAAAPAPNPPAKKAKMSENSRRAGYLRDGYTEWQITRAESLRASADGTTRNSLHTFTQPQNNTPQHQPQEQWTSQTYQYYQIIAYDPSYRRASQALQ